MAAIFINVFATMLFAALIALAAAALSWFLLSWSPWPGIGPIIVFLVTIWLLQGSDLDGLIKTFAGGFALVGLASFFWDKVPGAKDATATNPSSITSRKVRVPRR